MSEQEKREIIRYTDLGRHEPAHSICPTCGAGEKERHPLFIVPADSTGRYRSALERIESHGAGEAVRIAREALGRDNERSEG